MGFGEWIVRKGAPGGTARVVGNWFIKAKNEDPSISIEAFAEIFWGMRIQIGGYKKSQMAKVQALASDHSYDSLIEIIVHVLSVEVGDAFDDIYFDLSGPQRAIYQKVFREELTKLGVPREFIG